MRRAGKTGVARQTVPRRCGYDRDHTYFERLKGKPNRVEPRAGTTTSDTLRRSQPVEPDVQSRKNRGGFYFRAPIGPSSEF